MVCRAQAQFEIIVTDDSFGDILSDCEIIFADPSRSVAVIHVKRVHAAACATTAK
jgi:hypothetical protein